VSICSSSLGDSGEYKTTIRYPRVLLCLPFACGNGSRTSFVLAERVDGFEESETRFVFVGLRPLCKLVVAVFEKTAMEYLLGITNGHFN
jgi:hypothetical protein